MKKLLLILLTGGIIAGCGKDNEYSTNFASTVFINASPSVSGTSGRPGINIYYDTVKKTFTNVAYGGTTGYVPAAPGTYKFEVRSSIDNVTKYVERTNEAVEYGKASTVIIYDTLTGSPTAPTGTLKSVRLSDDMTPGTAGTLKFRLFNLAPKGGPVDITFLRTSVSPNDSVTFSNVTFIGGSPDPVALSAFNRSVPLGNYTIKIKNPGVPHPAITSATIGFPTNNQWTYTYTFFVTGNATGSGYAIGAFRHAP
jgi:hypothetical protein